MVSSTTDLGRIRNINFAHANLGEICNRAVSTTDLSELCCKSYNLPSSLIPALPSYELMDLPASCASGPMTMDYKEATGDLTEKVSLFEGKDRMTGKVSHARRGSKFSQEED